MVILQALCSAYLLVKALIRVWAGARCSPGGAGGWRLWGGQALLTAGVAIGWLEVETARYYRLSIAALNYDSADPILQRFAALRDDSEAGRHAGSVGTDGDWGARSAVRSAAAGLAGEDDDAQSAYESVSRASFASADSEMRQLGVSQSGSSAGSVGMCNRL